MGFLAEGHVMDWDESLQVGAVAVVKRDGISQLINIWCQNAARVDKELRWGDELELMLVHLDPVACRARLWVGADSLRKDLVRMEDSQDWQPLSEQSKTIAEAASILTGGGRSFLWKANWHPEFSSAVIEGTPAAPYDLNVDSLLDVEDSMISRRYKVQSLLPENVFVSSLAVFPMLGVKDYMSVDGIQDVKEKERLQMQMKTLVSGSSFIYRSFIADHPRFYSISNNPTLRAGYKASILIPVFKDSLTEESPGWQDSCSGEDKSQLTRSALSHHAETTHDPVRGQIYMDHFGFGMGNCCLQTTYLAPDLFSARYLHDQLTVLAPIMLCLSASSAAFRGLIADTDVRWRTLEQGCDCRTEAELDPNSPQYIPKSRYGAVQMYISNNEYLRENESYLNDVQVPVDETAYGRLVAAGMDNVLARHFAYIWKRDPLVIYDNSIDIDNETRSDHFENLQSSNWFSIRFKPPMPAIAPQKESAIGWRVEFRTPDIQLTDFENAAVSGIITLLVMAILSDNLNFYIPMTMCHKNFARAETRDAVLQSKFFFRKCVSSPENRENEGKENEGKQSDKQNGDICEMTAREIFLGSRRTGFIGLLPLLDKFVSAQWRTRRCSCAAVEKYRQYAELVRSRVRGANWTNAAKIRHALLSHSEYENDSIVSDNMNYSVVAAAVRRGFLPCNDLPTMIGKSPASLRCLEILSMATKNEFARKLVNDLHRITASDSPRHQPRVDCASDSTRTDTPPNWEDLPVSFEEDNVVVQHDPNEDANCTCRQCRRKSCAAEEDATTQSTRVVTVDAENCSSPSTASTTWLP